METMENADKFLSMKQVADVMNVKPDTLYNYRSKGKCDIPFVTRCGRTIIALNL